ncbi:MAG: hypothetical protein ACOYBJ_01720 [Patescibacteria group bacterium]|jgi:hypothetical protein
MTQFSRILAAAILTAALLGGSAAPTFAAPTTDTGTAPPVAASSNPETEAPGPDPAPTTNPITQQERAPARQQPGQPTHADPTNTPSVVYRTTYIEVALDDAAQFRKRVNGASVRQDKGGNFALTGLDGATALVAQALVAQKQATVRNGRFYLSGSANNESIRQAMLTVMAKQRAITRSNRQAVSGLKDEVAGVKTDVSNLDEKVTNQGGQIQGLVLTDEELSSRLDQHFWSMLGLLAGLILVLWLGVRANWRLNTLRDQLTDALRRLLAVEDTNVDQERRLAGTQRQVTVLHARQRAAEQRTDLHQRAILRQQDSIENLELAVTDEHVAVDARLRQLAGRLDDRVTGLTALDQRSQMLRNDLMGTNARVDQVEASDAQVRALLGLIAVNTSTPLPQGWKQPTTTP